MTQRSDEERRKEDEKEVSGEFLSTKGRSRVSHH
jgi:hypothetical protein